MELSVSYSAHVQTYGDRPAVKDGATAGTSGKSKRLESIKISLSDTSNGSIEYRSHVQRGGWESTWAKDGKMSGTSNQSRRLEGMQVRLTGDLLVKTHDVFYRVHSQTFGWLGWASNGEPAGTSGQSKRLEAFEVMVLPKGQVPKGYDASAPAFVGAVTANASVQTYGWLGAKSVFTLGTTGESKRLEAIRVTIPSQPYAGGIEYQSHVQRAGWETSWKADGAMSGTTGKSRRLEAVRMRLTGELANHLSVWYRVHSQTYGWGGWTRDGESAGTSGLSRRVEAIEVRILPKTAAAPGSTKNAMRTK